MYGYEVLHEQIAENLIENVRKGLAQHAYIFEGDRGVGTDMCARLFAAALVCENEENAPCGMCNACILAKANTHPDIYTVTPADGKKNIVVDKVREIVNDAYTKPYESGKKVYIISYGDDMNEQAQNAFLKVLEEPPQYAAFIILCENYESLLQTVRSRCTRIQFPPVSDKKIREYIEAHFPEETEKTKFLVQYAGGVAGNVEKILGNENFTDLRYDALNKLEILLSSRKTDAYSVAEFIEENKDDADLIFAFWQGFLHDMMLIQQGAKKLIQSADFIDKLINLSNKYDEKEVLDAQEAMLLAQKMRKRYVNLRTLTLRLAFSIKNKG